MRTAPPPDNLPIGDVAEAVSRGARPLHFTLSDATVAELRGALEEDLGHPYAGDDSEIREMAETTLHAFAALRAILIAQASRRKQGE